MVTGLIAVPRYSFRLLLEIAYCHSSTVSLYSYFTACLVIKKRSRNFQIGVLECLFAISDTSEAVTSMETASPNMAQVCVPPTSVIGFQNALPISAEPSLSSLNTILFSDNFPEEITSSRLLKKISSVPEISRKYSFEKIATLFFITEEAKNIKEKRKKQRGNKSREIESVNNPITSGLQGQRMQKKKSIKTDIHD